MLEICETGIPLFGSSPQEIHIEGFLGYRDRLFSHSWPQNAENLYNIISLLLHQLSLEFTF